MELFEAGEKARQNEEKNKSEVWNYGSSYMCYPLFTKS